MRLDGSTCARPVSQALRYSTVIGSLSAPWRGAGCCTLASQEVSAISKRMGESEARLVTVGQAGGNGVLVIRVWHEAGAANGFRARIIFGAGDDPAAETSFTIARNPDEVIAAVRRWLATMDR